MKEREFNKLSHTIYECIYHIVFCPKYRKKILQDDIAEYIKQQIYILCRQKDLVEVLELNIQVDHVHLIVSIPPKGWKINKMLFWFLIVPITSLVNLLKNYHKLT